MHAKQEGMMNRRSSERINVSLDAEIISGGLNYTASTKNISEIGVCVNTAPTDLVIHFPAEIIIELRLRSISGDFLSLNCKLAWAMNTLLNDKAYSLGMEVMNPPSEYKKLYKNALAGRILVH